MWFDFLLLTGVQVWVWGSWEQGLEAPSRLLYLNYTAVFRGCRGSVNVGLRPRVIVQHFCMCGRKL